MDPRTADRVCACPEEGSIDAGAEDRRGRDRLRPRVLGLLRGTAVLGAWVVNEHGDCVSEWTAGSLARGPLAVVNAPLARRL
jgi:hypothetical protein